MRLNRTHKIVIAAVAVITVILIIIGISSCAPSKEASAGEYSQASAVSCVPPLACGPSYAGYVPPYYLAHPSFAYLSPYSAFYAPTLRGGSYTAVRTPAGRAPVSTRAPMPYPSGYKPVPGDFQPPTAPKASAPAVKAPSKTPAKAPAPKAPAPKTPPRK
ncbi:MAG TPA: hypothetical protein VF867_04390 [Arthrobacter sp.]